MKPFTKILQKFAPPLFRFLFTAALVFNFISNSCLKWFCLFSKKACIDLLHCKTWWLDKFYVTKSQDKKIIFHDQLNLPSPPKYNDVSLNINSDTNCTFRLSWHWIESSFISSCLTKFFLCFALRKERIINLPIQIHFSVKHAHADTIKCQVILRFSCQTF